MRRAAPSRLLALVAPLLLLAVAPAAPSWCTLQAPHCLIVSQCPERETREWAADFEQFTAALLSRVAVDEGHLPPLTVVLFSSPERFDDYQPLDAQGHPRSVAGFCYAPDTWAVIGLGKRFRDDETTRHLVLHETTHWITSAARTHLPLWLNEGFAETFATFRTEKGKALVGEPLPQHVARLRQCTWVPFPQLILTTHRDPLYTDGERNRTFYAESWLFVHRLLCQPGSEGIKGLNTFFAARLRGADQFTAFQAAFGDLTKAEDACHEYAFGGAGRYLTFPVPTGTAVSAPYQPAAPAVVEIALARLALGSRREAVARKHLERALALDSAAPAAHELTAHLEQSLGHEPAAVAAARQALAAGSTDGLMHLLVARALTRRANERGEAAATAREIVDHYHQAIAAQPNYRNAYLGLAAAVRALPAPAPGDAEALIRGYKLFPDAPELLIGLAALVHQAGDDQQASGLLDRALGHTDLIDDRERATAERLRLEWRIAPLRARLDAAEKTKDHATALAACAEILAIPMPGAERLRWEKRRARLNYLRTMDDARQTARGGDRASAIADLEAALAEAELSPQERASAQRLLERLRNLQDTDPGVR